MQLSQSVYLVGGSSPGLTEGGDAYIYAVRGETGLILIDSGQGFDIEGLLRNITSHGLDPSGITHLLLTHHHPDHSGGAGVLRERLGCEVWIDGDTGRHLLEAGTDEEFHRQFGIDHGIFPPEFQFRHCPVDNGVADGGTFSLHGIDITAIRVTGHSPDSICYMMELDGLRCLFNGDTVFFGGVLGMINWPGSSMMDFHEGLPKLKGLGIDALFPGHGLFCLRKGQDSIDRALGRLDSVFVPDLVGQVHESIICYNQ